VTVLAILYVLGSHAWAALKVAGFGLITGSVWDPVAPTFGAWPFIYGTLYSSAIALVLAVPIGLLVALFLTELAPLWVRTPLGVLVELLAGVPSIVFGMWGLFVVIPKLRHGFDPWVTSHLGWIPLFRGPVGTGQSFLLAGLVLAIMILPTITSISRDALLAVPRLEREAAYALGATRWEVARTAIRSAKTGLFAAATLGLGRALGETIAVTLVIGNAARVTPRLFSQGQTLASTLASQVGEASDPTFISALIALGFILFVITLIVNLGARAVIERPWRRHA
jgi:phosphate transport system permease protein